MPVVLGERCPKDHACPMVTRCASHAITQKGLSAPEIDRSKCTECGLCVRSCPHKVFIEG